MLLPVLSIGYIRLWISEEEENRCVGQEVTAEVLQHVLDCVNVHVSGLRGQLWTPPPFSGMVKGEGVLRMVVHQYSVRDRFLYYTTSLWSELPLGALWLGGARVATVSRRQANALGMRGWWGLFLQVCVFLLHPG